MSLGNVKFYSDQLVVESILSYNFSNNSNNNNSINQRIFKQSQNTSSLIPSIIESVKEYATQHIDPNNKEASLVNFLAPAAVWALFKGLGFGKWGIILGLLSSMFHIDYVNIFKSALNSIQGLIKSGQPISSSQVGVAVQQAIQENDKDNSHSNDSLSSLNHCNLLICGLIDYENQLFQLTKQSETSSNLLKMGGLKDSGNVVLGSVLKWFFSLLLAAAGFMVVGDIANKLLGRDNALDKTLKTEHNPNSFTTNSPSPQASSQPEQTVISNQTKYKLKGDQALPPVLSIKNTPESIQSALIQMAKDVYSGLENKDDLIKESPHFQVVNQHIMWYNHSSQGYNLVYLPPEFTSKKQLVDHFIDDVANEDNKTTDNKNIDKPMELK